MMAEKSDVAVYEAIRGMLPKNSLGRDMIKKLRVYPATVRAQYPNGLHLPVPYNRRRTRLPKYRIWIQRPKAIRADLQRNAKAANYINLAKAKTAQVWWKTLILAALAGAFIALFLLAIAPQTARHTKILQSMPRKTP